MLPLSPSLPAFVQLAQLCFAKFLRSASVLAFVQLCFAKFLLSVPDFVQLAQLCFAKFLSSPSVSDFVELAQLSFAKFLLSPSIPAFVQQLAQRRYARFLRFQRWHLVSFFEFQTRKGHFEN